MEALWIISLYIICPLIGMFLTINASIKFKEKRGRFFLGLSLLCLPVLHLSLIESMKLSLENNIVGNYKLGNQVNALIIYDNGTFILNQTKELEDSGNGTWELFHVDIDELNLKFENHESGWLLLEVKKDRKGIELRTNPPADQQTVILIKE